MDNSSLLAEERDLLSTCWKIFMGKCENNRIRIFKFGQSAVLSLSIKAGKLTISYLCRISLHVHHILGQL